MLRVGVAGVGGLGKVHLGGLLKLGGRVQVVALADPVPERRAGKNLTSQNLNIDLNNQQAVSVEEVRSYDDFSGVCRDTEVDMVVIAMPTDLHAPGAIMALENGKHVFTEKPMALNVKDCKRMIAAARANRRKLMVGQVLRFWPAYKQAGKIMASRKYGKTLAAMMRRYGATPRSTWFADEKRSGGVRLDLHIHDVDAALWWWGKPAQIHSHGVGRAKTVSAVLSQWRYKSGLTVNLEAFWDIGTNFSADFRIIMEKATLEYGMCNDKGLLLTTADGTRPVPIEKAAISAYDEELNYFIRCVETGKAPSICPPEESALAVQYSMLQ